MRKAFWKFIFSFFTKEQLVRFFLWAERMEENYQEQKRLKKIKKSCRTTK